MNSIKLGIFCRGALVALCMAIVAGTAVAKPLLHAGDKMVFLGDSITEQKIYTRYIMNYFAMRSPGQNITFRNAGLGGDTSPGGLSRLQRDVFGFKPSVVSICFGMNDGRYTGFSQDSFNTYMTGIRGLISELKKAGVKVVLLTPGCVDADRNKGLSAYNDTLYQFAKGVTDLAAEQHVPVFDIHSLMLNTQMKAKAADPGFTMIPDGVHPSPAGHIIMAYGLLQALGCSGPASGLEINATKSTFTADRCSVNKLKVSENAVTFVRMDEALPVGFDTEVASILKYAPFIEDMNAYRLKVTGLKSGMWKVTVQGIDVGTYTADALMKGVDLSSQPGPWAKMGQEVNTLSAEQENVYFAQWRQVTLANLPSEAWRETNALWLKLDEIINSKEAARAKLTAERTWEWGVTFVQ